MCIFMCIVSIAFLSPEEMKSLFSSVPEAISNTVEITEKCNLELNFEENLMSQFPVPKGKTPESYLEELCQEGLKSYFCAIWNRGKRVD